MRIPIALTVSVAMLMVQGPLVPVFAQTASSSQQAAIQDPIIDATFKAFPSGGQPLSMRIADLIIANPKLAPKFVVYLQTAQGLNRAQKMAAENGLAAAADKLGIRAQVGDGQNLWAWIAALGAIGVGVGMGVYGATQGHGNNTPGCVPTVSPSMPC